MELFLKETLPQMCSMDVNLKFSKVVDAAQEKLRRFGHWCVALGHWPKDHEEKPEGAWNASDSTAHHPTLRFP